MMRAVSACAGLRGTIDLPGDKSISHRYAMLAAIAEGDTRIRRFASGGDCRSTLNCLRALGVAADAHGTSLTVEGRGLRGLRAPEGELNAGNSGTTMRLLAGILAGQDFDSVLTGDKSLSRRPMQRILEPLRLMGSRVAAGEGGLPPLRIRGGCLQGIRYPLPVASAQVKSCILLAGMYASGATSVLEDIPTRDHTEIALSEFGATVLREEGWIRVEPGPRLRGLSLEVPADLSGAAFFAAAAALVPDSDICLPAVGLNRRRRALIDYLQGCGMHLSVERETESAGEARGDLRVRYDPGFLQGGLARIDGALSAALIDEIPVLSVLATQVAGGLEVRDARELRYKESDRIAALATNLRAMGAGVEELQDGLRVGGGQRLRGADIASRGDHRIAMAFAVAGLAAGGETRIHEAECADVSFPGFWEVLARAASGPERA